MSENGFKITVNSQKVLIALGQAPERFMSASRKSLYEAGTTLFNEISKGILYTEKHGVYYKYKRTFIRASAPGEFTANRSGKLRRSYDFKVDGFRSMRFGSALDYALYTELGTANMSPRYNIKQGIEKSNASVLNTMRQNLDEELKNL